ncbi:hypothetical protein EV702DRAFT_1265864 [Suillus placidus]|uniref:Uncharacterized protein n=1 Tax=Suillus placidus TaxID=48579 RepID=A0A9P7A4B3_9AGAM|nr:hypothetical protein EV702DRAFT_1265864 [Suillus placidus]
MAEVTCELCSKSFKPRGFKTHRTACTKWARDFEEDQHHIANTYYQPPVTVNVQGDAYHAAEQADNLNQAEVESLNAHIANNPAVDDDQWMDVEDEDIYRVPSPYNLSVDGSEHQDTQHNRDILQDPPTPDAQPWVPFQCRLDFEAAELAHEAALSQPQIDRLINLLHCSKQESFTLRNYKDVRSMWNAISHRLTPFQKQTIRVPYDGVDQEFTLYYWDLWDCACDLLRNPYVGPQFTFDTQHLSKFDRNVFVRLIDEPWTADTFWEAQSAVPGHAKPLAFILYADKAKLSSFGREKGYPVIAHIANLPTSIRNGEGVGGDRVVTSVHMVIMIHPKYCNYHEK